MAEQLIKAWSQISDALLFAVIGMVIGFGQSKAKKETDTGVIIGRSITVGGLAMAAGMILIWVPELPRVGQIGVAAALASLGTSGLERIILRWIDARSGRVEG